MKGREIWCASQASTAICMSMEHLASSSSTIHLGSNRAIDRHNPIIREGRSSTASEALPPRSFELPFTPRLLYQKARKSLSNYKATDDIQKKKVEKQSDQTKRKSSAIIREGRSSTASEALPPRSFELPFTPRLLYQKARKSLSNYKATDDIQKKKVEKQSDQTKRKSFAKAVDLIRRSCVKPADLLTPPGSSRYLLSENGFFDLEQDLALVPRKKVQALQAAEPPAVTKNDYIFRGLARSSSYRYSNAVQVPSVQQDSSSQTSRKSSSPSPGPIPDQVVVLKVSLHCKGCAGKVSKHISRMQGVTSFDIDFAAKKVTVTGNVTPIEVLASVSKVKKAQLWTTEKPKSSPPSFIVSN